MVKTYVEILERDLDERRKLEFEADVATEDGGVFKLLNDEMNNGIVSSSEQKPKKPPKWQCVYLTVYELEGLKLLCERLRSWSYAKLNYPKTLKEDSMELLDRLEVSFSTSHFLIFVVFLVVVAVVCLAVVVNLVGSPKTIQVVRFVVANVVTTIQVVCFVVDVVTDILNSEYSYYELNIDCVFRCVSNPFVRT